MTVCGYENSISHIPIGVGYFSEMAAGALNVSQTKQTSWIHKVVCRMHTWVCTEQRCFIVDFSLKDSMWAKGLLNTYCFCEKFFPSAAPSLVLWVVWSIPPQRDCGHSAWAQPGACCCFWPAQFEDLPCIIHETVFMESIHQFIFLNAVYILCRFTFFQSCVATYFFF